MARIVFVQPDEQVVEVDGRIGDTVMHTAVANQVQGIVAECGGSMACATCHVYVDDDWLGRLSPLSPGEGDMLDATASGRRENSRLACQIELTEHLDGLRLTIPDMQL